VQHPRVNTGRLKCKHTHTHRHTQTHTHTHTDTHSTQTKALDWIAAAPLLNRGDHSRSLIFFPLPSLPPFAYFSFPLLQFGNAVLSEARVGFLKVDGCTRTSASLSDGCISMSELNVRHRYECRRDNIANASSNNEKLRVVIKGEWCCLWIYPPLHANVRSGNGNYVTSEIPQGLSDVGRNALAFPSEMLTLHHPPSFRDSRIAASISCLRSARVPSVSLLLFFNSVYLHRPFSQITNLSQRVLQSVHIDIPVPEPHIGSGKTPKNTCVSSLGNKIIALKKKLNESNDTMT